MPRVMSMRSAKPSMYVPGARKRSDALCAAVSSILIAVSSLVRGLPMFFSSRPKTPLRVLCIVAFDTLHRLRHAKPLPPSKIRLLAALLDLGACANADFDDKACCRGEFRRTLQLLEDAGIGPLVDQYLQRLKDAESRRPQPGGDFWQFQKVAMYREAVVRLSLAMLAAIANDSQCLDQEILATYRDADLNLLLGIAMQCQIIDDVLDYSQDKSAGLPSFLTASGPVSQAYELTRLASRSYADNSDLPPTGDLLPLRAALLLVSTCTKLLVVLGGWRARIGQQLAKRACDRQPLAPESVDVSAFH